MRALSERPSALAKARLLWIQSQPTPLLKYLDDWKAGKEQVPADYVLEVIYAYDDLLRQRKEVIP